MLLNSHALMKLMNMDSLEYWKVFCIMRITMASNWWFGNLTFFAKLIVSGFWSITSRYTTWRPSIQLGKICLFNVTLNMLKPYAIHPTSNIIFLGIPEMIFSYHLNMQKLELFFGVQDDRKIVWGQIFVFAYSCCFVILNDYSRTHWSFSSCKYHLVLFSYRVWFFHLAQSYGHVLWYPSIYVI